MARRRAWTSPPRSSRPSAERRLPDRLGPAARPRRSFASEASAAWPVRVRNTSSRSGGARRRRGPRRPRRPAGAGRRPAPGAAGRSPDARHRDPPAVLLDRRTRRGRAPRAAAAASASRAASATTTSIRSPPTCALSSSAVPRAITRPWSMTTMHVGEPVGLLEVLGGEQQGGAVGDERRRSPPTCRSRLRGSRPVVGSSRKSTRGRATSAPARSSRRRMPPE